MCADSLVICLRNRVEGIVYIEEERQPDVYQNDFRIYISKEINRIETVKCRNTFLERHKFEMNILKPV